MRVLLCIWLSTYQYHCDVIAPQFTRHSVYCQYTMSIAKDRVSMYNRVMPKLWNDTIETHRREVRDAIMETAAALVAEHGLRSVTMSQIAEKAGIGRATLYKYFSGVEAILLAWHEHQVAAHLEHLGHIRNHAGNPREGLAAVLEAYGLIVHEYQGNELAPLMHQGEHVAHARQHLSYMIRDLLAEATSVGVVRGDVSPEELASYCLNALAAAGELQTKAAVRRLVTVILAGLQPLS